MENTLNTINQLDIMRTRRELSVERATMDMLWDYNEIDPLFDVSDIVRDNKETDRDIIKHFIGHTPEGHELHFKGCQDVNVSYCICMPDKSIRGGVL